MKGLISHSVSRGVFYLSIEKAAALVSGVLYFAMLLRWLGPTKYGIMTLALSFAGLATMATGNFEMYLERYAAEYHARGQVKTLRRAQDLALAFKLGLGALAAIVLIGLAPLLARQFSSPELALLLPLLAVLVATDGLGATGRATLFGLQQFKWVCLLAVVFHAAKTVLVGVLWATHQGLLALAVGLSALTALQGLAQTVVPMWIMRNARDPLPGQGPPSPDSRALLRDILRYCLPLLGARATFMSGQNLGKIVLGKLFSPTDLGYFSFAFQTIERFVELVHALPASLLPSFTQLVARGERERLQQVLDHALRIVQVVACGLSLVLFVFAREITLLVGSPLFEPAVPLLRILALVPIARTAQQPLTMLFLSLRMPGHVLRLAIVKFVAEFASYFALVPVLGLAGAGYANLIGAVVSFGAAWLILARVLPQGGDSRWRTLGATLVVFLPIMALAALIEARAPQPWSVGLRLALLPAALFGVFALGLVNGYDLQRVSDMPLESTWMRAVRDRVVAVAERLLRVAKPRSTTT